MEFITPEDWIGKYAQNSSYQLIDIREPYECIGTKASATFIPMEELVEHPEKISKDKNCVIMCNSGKRASALVNLLETEFGFQHLSVLEGGYQALETRL